jgi:hypothetical protein
VLLDLRAQAVVSGYAHATVTLWSPDRVYLGQVSQTIALREHRPASALTEGDSRDP